MKTSAQMICLFTTAAFFSACGSVQMPTNELIANIPCDTELENEMMVGLLSYARENELTTMSSTGSSPRHFGVSVLVNVDSVRVERTNRESFTVSFMPHFANMNPPGHEERVAEAKAGVEGVVREVCANGYEEPEA